MAITPIAFLHWEEVARQHDVEGIKLLLPLIEEPKFCGGFPATWIHEAVGDMNLFPGRSGQSLYMKVYRLLNSMVALGFLVRESKSRYVPAIDAIREWRQRAVRSLLERGVHDYQVDIGALRIALTGEDAVEAKASSKEVPDPIIGAGLLDILKR